MLAARLRRGFTVNTLAEAMGVDRRTISRHDAGLFAPSTEHLRAAARALRFPERFFLGSDIGVLAPEVASFRWSSKLTARQRDMALGSVAVAGALNGEIEQLYALPECDLPELAHRCDPKQAADFVRRKWKLDERPIEGMMQLLESKGVRIFSLPADAASAGTFSSGTATTPSSFSTLRIHSTSGAST
jgi:transcriptional regulator with XRE-family HTH domain